MKGRESLSRSHKDLKTVTDLGFSTSAELGNVHRNLKFLFLKF
jgi:hypothetical protein